MEPLLFVSIFFDPQLLTVWRECADSIVTNFIQQPLPDGSSTGAGFNGQSGALGSGQRAATGLTTCMFNALF